MNALLRREYGVNPEKLSDARWLRLYAEYQFSEKRRFENLSLALKSALAEVLSAAFGRQE